MAHDNLQKNPNVLELTADNWEAEVLQSDVPVLVDFWAPWCMPCRQLKPIVERIADQFAGKAKVAMMDIGEEKNQDLAAEQKVSGIPRVNFYKGGKMVQSISGVRPEVEFTQILNGLLKS